MLYKIQYELFLRLITGIIYILLIFFSINQGEKFFRILMMILSYCCFFELLIIFKIHITFIQISSYILIFPIFIDLIMTKKLYIICFILYYIISLIVYLIFLNLSYKDKMTQIIHILFSLVYVIIPFYLSYIIYSNFDQGKNIIFNTFIIIWTNDTCSFLIGKKFGTQIISIFISPKKTIEGVCGGILCSFIFILYLNIWLIVDIEWIFLSIIISIFATIGDFIESMIKRSYNVKHSGILFPGHGGFLDRFDSYIIVIPIITIIYFFKNLLNN